MLSRLLSQLLPFIFIQSGTESQKEVLQDIFSLSKTSEKSQSFKVKPQNVSSLFNQRAVLTCTVGNKVGELRWYKGSILIGSERDMSLPSFPRYTIENKKIGEYNLAIEKADIIDEGEYECRVHSSHVSKQKDLSAKGFLTVVYPPTFIYFYVNDKKLEASESFVWINLLRTEHTFACKTPNTKPPVRVRWFDRKTNGITTNKKEETEKKKYKRDYFLYDVTTTITLHNYEIDGHSVFMCQAYQDVLGQSFSRKLKIKLIPLGGYDGTFIVNAPSQRAMFESSVYFHAEYVNTDIVHQLMWILKPAGEENSYHLVSFLCRRRVTYTGEEGAVGSFYSNSPTCHIGGSNLSLKNVQGFHNGHILFWIIRLRRESIMTYIPFVVNKEPISSCKLVYEPYLQCKCQTIGSFNVIAMIIKTGNLETKHCEDVEIQDIGTKSDPIFRTKNNPIITQSCTLEIEEGQVFELLLTFTGSDMVPPPKHTASCDARYVATTSLTTKHTTTEKLTTTRRTTTRRPRTTTRPRPHTTNRPTSPKTNKHTGIPLTLAPIFTIPSTTPENVTLIIDDDGHEDMVRRRLLYHIIIPVSALAGLSGLIVIICLVLYFWKLREEHVKDNYKFDKLEHGYKRPKPGMRSTLYDAVRKKTSADRYSHIYTNSVKNIKGKSPEFQRTVLKQAKEAKAQGKVSKQRTEVKLQGEVSKQENKLKPHEKVSKTNGSVSTSSSRSKLIKRIRSNYSKKSKKMSVKKSFKGTKSKLFNSKVESEGYSSSMGERLKNETISTPC